ncbi:MAG: carboxypeptidase-like regulatory domain-containing protein [Bacteroidales bacterium]|nr:carboxypeptidase-like regulatory domain-containing protein [Bacteroidales bacterium]
MRNLKFTFLLAMLFMAFSTGLVAQNIKGIVKDAMTGDKLPGATVSVKGTTTGVTTDVDGAFNLETDAGEQVIVFRFLGYESRQMTVQVSQGRKQNA